MGRLYKIKLFGWFTFLLNLMYLFLLISLMSNFGTGNMFDKGKQMLALLWISGFLIAPIIGRIGFGYMIFRSDRFLKKGIWGILLLEVMTMFYLFLWLKHLVLIPILILVIYYFSMFFYFLPRVYEVNKKETTGDSELRGKP